MKKFDNFCMALENLKEINKIKEEKPTGSNAWFCVYKEQQ